MIEKRWWWWWRWWRYRRQWWWHIFCMAWQGFIPLDRQPMPSAPGSPCHLSGLVLWMHTTTSKRFNAPAWGGLWLKVQRLLPLLSCRIWRMDKDGMLCNEWQSCAFHVWSLHKSPGFITAGNSQWSRFAKFEHMLGNTLSTGILGERTARHDLICLKIGGLTQSIPSCPFVEWQQTNLQIDHDWF